MASSVDMKPRNDTYPSRLLRSLFVKPPAPPEGFVLTGKTGIIVGGSGGIGYECARQLLTYKLSTLVITGRNKAKGQDAAAKLRKLSPEADVQLWDIDLGSYDSIRAFLAQCQTSLKTIDFVIISAAEILIKSHLIPSTGFEAMFQVNYLSTVLLTVLLLPVLRSKRGDPATATTTTPIAPPHITLIGSSLDTTFPEMGATPLLPAFKEQPNFTMSSTMDRYMTTKLLLMMFLAKVKDAVDARDVIINMADPGTPQGSNEGTNQGLDRHMPGAVRVVGRFAKKFIGRPLRDAAWTFVDGAVVKGAESHGSYIYDWQISPFPAIMYKDEGKRAMEQLWKETLDELQFADAKRILGVER